MYLRFLEKDLSRYSPKEQERYTCCSETTRVLYSTNDIMSVILRYNDLTHNKAARKAMESYTGILQKAFEHYQNLWQDYIKLQEKCEQFTSSNVPSSSQMAADTPCTKTNEAVSQYLNSTTAQESNSIPLLELKTMNVSTINFETETLSLDASESVHNNTDDENDPPKSPIFSRASLWVGKHFAKKSIRSPKARYNNSNTDMKSRQNIEKVSSKHNNKLEISTTHHVETTFLPNGKRLKQSRLAFYPVENDEKTIPSSSVDKHKTANAVLSVKQSFSKDISETSEDVIEISPTQRNVTSNVKRCLKLKRKIPSRHMKKILPSKTKCSSSTAAPDIIDEIDFGLSPSPKHNSTQVKDGKSLMNTAVNIFNTNTSSPLSIRMHSKTDRPVTNFTEADKDELKKDQLLLINKVETNTVSRNINDFACGDETFYLPAEQAANRNNMDNFNLDDVENEPPEKMMLSSKFNVVSNRKADFSEQLNMRCKADRAKLNGWDCWECKEYYEKLSLSKEELQKRKNQCSRHRYKYERPNTPEGFWNPEFPETLSCTYRHKS